MKKIVSAPRLHHSAIIDASQDILNQSQPRISDEPVKLGDYLKYREDANKTAIMQRIKSNPNLMAYEDPVVKEIREKKDDILRNTDKIISLLSKKKTELNGKVLEELLEHEDMLKQVLEIINSKDKNKIVSKKQLISSKNLPKPPPAQQISISKTNGFTTNTTPKLTPSSYLNKTSYGLSSKQNTKRSQKVSFSNAFSIAQQNFDKSSGFNLTVTKIK